MNTKWNCRLLFILAGGMLGLVGCGGSSNGGESTGTLNIGLTDGPVASAEAVYILFTGLEVKPAGGPSETYDISPTACDPLSTPPDCLINLLDLTGMEYRSLFAEDMPAGEYQWVRLLVKAEQNDMDSYIVLLDETENLIQCSLWIPSGSETGLKIVSGMTVTANGESNYMLDFDVRKSITAPPGLSSTESCTQSYVLKPAIRMVDETETSSIAGTVDASILTDVEVCRDEDQDGLVDSLNVYVFENFDGQANLDDFDGDGDPIAFAVPKSSDGGLTYNYEVGYLLAGNYKLGLTCTGDEDEDAAVADNFDCDFTQQTCDKTDPPFGFVAERDVTVALDDIADGGFPE